jgi:hypothetical protein
MFSYKSFRGYPSKCSKVPLNHLHSQSVGALSNFPFRQKYLLVLHIGSDQARFKFAKEAIELRKRGIARGLGAEETVVLAFGQSNFGNSAVHVTRKLRKRPLWKVNS